MRRQRSSQPVRSQQLQKMTPPLENRKKEEPSNIPIFIYGTLQASELLSWLLTGSSTNAESITQLFQRHPAVLYDYTRIAVKHADYPALIPSPSPAGDRDRDRDRDRVDAYVIYPRDETDRKKIDNFEGESYSREVVSVSVCLDHGTGIGEMVTAYAYVWAGEMDVLRLGREWVFERFRRERLDDWIELFDGMEMVG